MDKQDFDRMNITVISEFRAAGGVFSGKPLILLLNADQPPAPKPIRKALHAIDIHITETIDQARLLPKAA